MRKKGALGVTLAVALVASLCGCGGQNSEQQTTT